MNTQEKKPTQQPSKTHKTLTIIGIVLCAILIPILIINCALIIQSFVNKDEVPNLFGISPMIVLTDSMYPEIKAGDLIIVTDVEAADVEVGNDISFFDPAGNGTSVVTHRVIEKIVDEETGKISFKTKGINNNTEDKKPVPSENLVGLYEGFRIPLVGHVALFMQSTWGLVICVVVPLILLVGYDILRRKKHDKKKSDDVAALQAELEALRAMQNAEYRTQNDESKAPSEKAKDAEKDVQNEESQNEITGVQNEETQNEQPESE